MKKEEKISISYWDLPQVIAHVEYLKETHDLKDGDFSFEYHSEYDVIYPVLCYFREETEKERLVRETQEATWKKSREDYERRQYEELKKKFEEGKNN